MQYTHAKFSEDLASLKAASATSDPTALAGAASYARSLLGAAGVVGSIVAARRGELQAALAACESTMTGLMQPPSAPPPEEPAPQPVPEGATEPTPIERETLAEPEPTKRETLAEPGE